MSTTETALLLLLFVTKAAFWWVFLLWRDAERDLKAVLREWERTINRIGSDPAPRNPLGETR